MEKKLGPVKPNNTKAPRFGRAAFTYHIVRESLWEQWAKDTGNKLSFKEFKETWDLIAAEICSQIIRTAQGVRLPFFNGDISLKYVQMREKPVNGLASAAAGKTVRYLDWHTDKRPGKIVWAIKHAMARNRWVQLYGFSPCRKLRNLAAHEGFIANPGLYQVSRATDFNKKQL